MSSNATVREALIAEAIGDVAQLLDRLDAVRPALEEALRGLDQAADGFDARVGTFESRMLALTETAKVRAVEHIARRTDQLSRQALEAQTRAMADAARMHFRAEVDPALQRLTVPLQRLLQSVDRPWELWLTHAATAAVVSAATWLMAAWLWVS